MRLRHIKTFVIVFAGLFFFGGRPVEFGKENTFFHGFVIPNPVIRIGLGTGLGDILVRSSSGMKVYEVGAGYELLGDDVEEARVKGEKERLTEKFVLLMAQTKDRKEAEQIAAGVRERTGLNVSVDEARESGFGGVFQVKIGDYLTRGDALSVISGLKAKGLKDIWVLREFISLEDAGSRWILIGNGLRPLGMDSVLYFIPSHPESLLSFGGRRYRGIFILRSGPRGAVLINVLNLEDYLKGVVPGELSPDQFGEIEALKAQAVAARTYAIKNTGQYRALGYDLSDTPASQVYGGLDAERPLSTRAVDETRGEVIRYKGELINALYMSTCGGMTEDVENVFPGRPVAYLKSTECVIEKRPEWTVESGSVLAPIVAAGRDAAPELAALMGRDILPFETEAPYYSAPCPFPEAVEWVRNALFRAGKGDFAFNPGPGPLDFPSLAGLLVTAFDWRGHVENLLLPSEIDFILRDLPGIEPKDRKNLAYCVQMGLFPFLPAGPQGAGRTPTRAEVACALSRVLAGRADPFHGGTFRSASAGALELASPEGPRTLKISPRMFLLRTLDGVRSSMARLHLLGGETVRWLETDGEIRLLEVSLPSASDVLDRASRFNRWEVRKSREDLENAVNQHDPVGRLIDIAVRRRGASHRVVELLITGTDRQVLVRGLRIRTALGLRDTLFEVDRELDAEGRVAHFVFTGRGWGHGVGLCQVGAFGMAQTGATYQAILQKYYHGVRVEKLP
jgi:stage II sporulation protein D